MLWTPKLSQVEVLSDVPGSGSVVGPLGGTTLSLNFENCGVLASPEFLNAGNQQPPCGSVLDGMNELRTIFNRNMEGGALHPSHTGIPMRSSRSRLALFLFAARVVGATRRKN